jgi:hypothetical protein
MKQWQEKTRNGTSVRIGRTDAPEPFPVQGAAYMPHSAERFDHKGWFPCEWTSDGKHAEDSGLDLLPVDVL